MWQGTGDMCVSPAHAEWWCDTVAGAELFLLEGEGHVSLAGRHAGRILDDVVAQATTKPAPHQQQP